VNDRTAAHPSMTLRPDFGYHSWFLRGSSP
jgi:hypothetical protein